MTMKKLMLPLVFVSSLFTGAAIAWATPGFQECTPQDCRVMRRECLASGSPAYFCDRQYQQCMYNCGLLQ